MTDALKPKYPGSGLAATDPSALSSELLWEVVEEVRDHALVLLDTHGRIVSWHDGAQDLLGYEACEIIGTHFSRLYPPQAVEAGWPELELKLAATQGRFVGEGWRMRRDGSRFWASVELTAIRDRAGELHGFGKMARVVGQRKRPSPADGADFSAHRLINWLSNELRNPLAPICSAVHLLRRHRKDGKEIERWLEIMDRQSARLVQLADDLLDLSRAADGTLRLARRESELGLLLPRVLEACSPILAAQGQVLRVELPADPVRFWGDPVRLVQVLTTLVLRAANSSASDASLWLLARSDESELEIRVGEPGGQVMDERILDPPERLTGGEDPIEPVMGLTLALARHLIELHGGSLEAGDTSEGIGEEFVIRLPLSAPEPVLAETARAVDSAAEAIQVPEEPPVRRTERHFVTALHFGVLQRLLSATWLPLVWEPML
jgi:PAS domain S-box-containing protein